MTDIQRLPRAQIVPLTDGRATVSGTLDQVDAVLTAARRAGRLASVTDPVPTGQAGQVMVTVRVLPRQRQPAPTRRIRPGVVVAIIAAAVAVVAGAGWAAMWFLNAAGNAAAFAGVVLAVVILATVGGRRCCKTIVTVTHRHR